MVTHPHGGEAYWNDTATYYDSKDFKAYAAVIEEIIHSVPDIELEDGSTTPGTITVRSIHTRLGDHVNRRWTQDAIESLKSVETDGAFPTIPTRYRRKLGVEPMFPKIPKGESMRWIFGSKFAIATDEATETIS